MVYYFDITETFVTTVGVEADDIQQAFVRAEELYDSKVFDLGGSPHDIEIECVQAEVQDLIDLKLIAPEEIEVY